METAKLKEFRVSKQAYVRILAMFNRYVFHRKEDDGSIHVLLDKKQESEVRKQPLMKLVEVND